MSDDANEKAFDAAELFEVEDFRGMGSNVEEAIEMYLEHYMSPGCDPLNVIDEQCPIEVYAYERKEVDERWAHDEAERLWVKLEEDWDEEFGDSAEGTDWEKSAPLEAFAKALTEAMTTFATTQPVWQCEEIASRSFDYDQVVEMMTNVGYLEGGADALDRGEVVKP